MKANERVHVIILGVHQSQTNLGNGFSYLLFHLVPAYDVFSGMIFVFSRVASQVGLNYQYLKIVLPIFKTENITVSKEQDKTDKE